VIGRHSGHLPLWSFVGQTFHAPIFALTWLIFP